MAARVLGLARRRAETNSVSPVQRPQVTLSSVEVCAFSGRRPGARCTHRVRERFGHGADLPRPCDAHDRAGKRLVDPGLRGWLRRERPANVAFSPGSERSVTATAGRRPSTRWSTSASGFQPAQPPSLSARRLETPPLQAWHFRWTASPFTRGAGPSPPATMKL